MRRLVLVVVALFVVSACGGKDDTPVAPAPVIPNYTGIWQGSYTVTSCTQNGTITLANVCGQFAPGQTLQFQLNIIQQGTAIISGNALLGQLPFTVVPANLSSTGTVTLTGSSQSGTLTILSTWTLQTPITGTLSLVWSSSGLTGQVNIQSNIGAVVKTGSARTPVPHGDSLADVVRALQR
jgi:hypothetical protein